MIRFSVFSLCIAFVLLQSCGKDSNPVDSGTDAANSYYPLTEGSTWVYASSFAPNSTSTVAGDTMIGGTVYKKIAAQYEGSSTTQFGFSRSVGNGINYPETDPQGIFRDVVLLKDNAKPGDSWSYLSDDDGQESFYEYTCDTVGIQRTVRGRTYSNVIKINSTLGFNFAGQRLVAGTATTYYAKGVGLIEVRTLSKTQNQSVELVSYSIK